MEKVVIYKIKRKAWNKSFPYSLQKEPALPTPIYIFYSITVENRKTFPYFINLLLPLMPRHPSHAVYTSWPRSDIEMHSEVIQEVRFKWAIDSCWLQNNPPPSSPVFFFFVKNYIQKLMAHTKKCSLKCSSEKMD